MRVRAAESPASVRSSVAWFRYQLLSVGLAIDASTAVAWRINEEPWLRNSDILNNLKLRLGWGQIGNDKIGDNAFLQTIFNSGPTFVGYPFGINPEIAAGATVLTYVNTARRR